MHYRGYNITQDNPYSNEYYAHDLDADYDYDGIEGPHGGYFQCSGNDPHSGSTLEDVKEEIDIYFQELALTILERETGWVIRI